MIKPYVIKNNPNITALYTIFKNKLASDFHFSGETHDFWELVCVTEGCISVAADDKIFELKRGQAILHNPMQFHNINCTSNGTSEIIVITFSGKNIPQIQNNVCEISDISTINMLFENAQKTYKTEDIFVVGERENADLFFIKKLELFIMELSDRLIKYQGVVSQGALNYSMIVKTMNENIDKRLSVKDLASLCRMSEINLQKTFSKYAGVGVMEYFNRLKINRATESIKEGKSVKEAALSVGFSDQNYFSTVFKRITGRPPTHVKDGAKIQNKV